MPLTKPERDAHGQAHHNGQGDVLSVPFYNGEQDRDEGELTPDRKIDIAGDKKCRRANGGYTDRRAVEEDREEIRSCPKARVVEQPEKEEQCAEENGQAYSPRRLPGRLGAPGQMITAPPAGPKQGQSQGGPFVAVTTRPAACRERGAMALGIAGFTCTGWSSGTGSWSRN